VAVTEERLLNSQQIVDRPELRAITAGLAATRSRLRRLFATYGVTCLVVGALAVLVTAFLLDRFLNLPRPVRAIELLIALAAFGYGVYRFLIYPLSRPVRLEDMALAVEKRFRNLIYWNELSAGGHFAAFEQPEVFVRELRSCFESMNVATAL